MEPTLDDCLAAFYIARNDLAKAEEDARKLFNQLEDASRLVREKRALVARCRSEVLEKMPPEGKA